MILSSTENADAIRDQQWATPYARSTKTVTSMSDWKGPQTDNAFEATR